jgi:hypothetical protein
MDKQIPDELVEKVTELLHKSVGSVLSTDVTIACPYPPTLQNPDYPAGSGKCPEDCLECLARQILYLTTLSHERLYD